MTYGTLLKAAAAITSSAAPTVGQFNKYDATAAARTPSLPAPSSVVEGAQYGVVKSDSSANTVTLTAAGGDTFESDGTTLVLKLANEKRVMQCVVIGGTKYWSVVSGNTSLSSLDGRFAVLGVVANVEDFGVRVTNTGAHNTTALSAATAAFSAAGGGRIWFPPKT